MSQQLRDEAPRFDFFQAVRLLEREADHRRSEGADGPRHPVGMDGSPRREVVRFAALPSHSFPAGSISEIRPGDDGDDSDAEDAGPAPPEMTVTFMGLTGPGGVLPRHYTTLVIDRVHGKDNALRDFLDLFNHRAISFFYRAWEKYRFPIGYERANSTRGGTATDNMSTTGGMPSRGGAATGGMPSRGGAAMGGMPSRGGAAMGGMPSRGGAAGRHGTADDLLTRCLYCLLGLGTDRLRGRLEFDDEAFLFYAGHFAHRPRSALALESVLADYFELPLQIKQFLGQWLYLRESDQSALPSPRRPRGLNTQLGVNVVAGERVWGIESKFRARFGPLGYREFCRFLPSGDALRPVCQMIRCYVGPEYDFDVQPVLKAEEVPWCCLGGDGDSPARLGWNTWIRSRTLRQDVSDAVFSLEGLPWTT